MTRPWSLPGAAPRARLHASQLAALHAALLAFLTLLAAALPARAEFHCLPAEVRTENGFSVLYAGGEPVTPMSFCSRNNQDDRYLADLLGAGVKIHFPICDTEWKDPEGFAKLRVLAGRILAQDPEAILILRLSLDPPRDWMEQHPAECIRFENGEVRMIINTKIGRTYDPVLTDNLKFSLASTAWQERAEEALAEFVKKVEASEFAHRVAGYFFTASETEEWYYTVTYDRRYHAHDFSPPMLAYFKEFLREKYGTDQALAAAWNNDVKSFDQVRIPQLAERTLYAGVGELVLRRYDSRSSFGTLANPDFSEFESDYYRAVNRSVADAIIRFGRRVKQLSGGKLLTGAFYGHLTCSIYHEMGVAAAVERIQDSGAIDICSAPGTYFNRAVGGYATSRAPMSSFNLRKMIWWNEDDTRTHLSDPSNHVKWSQAADAWESCELLKRDMAKNLTQRSWSWWFENTNRDKWYHHPELIATIGRIQELFAASRRLAAPRGAEVALLVSEPSIFHTDHETLRDQLMWQRELEFDRAGVPYDYYYVRDLAHPAMPDYKLYVFLNALTLSDADRAAIREKIARKGATALWIYAPGLINPEASPQLSVAHMEELTGFDFDFKRGDHRPSIVIDNPRHPLTANLARDRHYGCCNRVIFGSFETKEPGHLLELGRSLTDPLFFLADSSQGAGGIYYGEKNLIAIGETTRAGYRSLWVGTKYLDAELLREAARRAGAHVWSESGDPFWADGAFAVIHGGRGGERTLRFPAAVDCYEVFERKTYGRGVREVSFPLRFGETKVFSLKGKL